MEAELTLAAEEPRIESTDLRSKKLAALLLLGLTAVFVTSVLFRPPAGDYFTICAFKNFSGLPCPGCGLTHSFCALGKGDVIGAFLFNGLGPPLFIAFVFIWVRSVCVLLNVPAAVDFFARITERFNIVRAFAIAFVVYGVGRIVYVVVYHPGIFGESPLSKLIANLVH